MSKRLAVSSLLLALGLYLPWPLHSAEPVAGNAATELPCLAHGIHHFAQQFLIGDVVAGTGIATALDDLAPEALNFIGSHVGFYSFDLERVLLEEGLIIREKRYSPLPFLGKLFNSQVFYSLTVAD